MDQRKKMHFKIMKSFALLLFVVCCSLSCSNNNVSQEDEERIAATRLHNAFDSIFAALTINSNLAVMARTNWPGMVSGIATQDPVLNELLTRRTGGSASLAILSTNLHAWISPKLYGSEIAIILPDSLQKDGQTVFMGIRFDGDLVYFIGLHNQ
jgi:hypothetical protein